MKDVSELYFGAPQPTTLVTQDFILAQRKCIVSIVCTFSCQEFEKVNWWVKIWSSLSGNKI